MDVRRTEVRQEGSLNAGCLLGYLVGFGIARGDRHCILVVHDQTVGNLADQAKSIGCILEVVVRSGHTPVLGTDMLNGLAWVHVEDKSWTAARHTVGQNPVTDAALALAPAMPARVRSAVQPVRHLRQLAVWSALAEHSGSPHGWRAYAMGCQFRPW